MVTAGWNTHAYQFSTCGPEIWISFLKLCPNLSFFSESGEISQATALWLFLVELFWWGGSINISVATYTCNVGQSSTHRFNLKLSVWVRCHIFQLVLSWWWWWWWFQIQTGFVTTESIQSVTPGFSQKKMSDSCSNKRVFLGGRQCDLIPPDWNNSSCQLSRVAFGDCSPDIPISADTLSNWQALLQDPFRDCCPSPERAGKLILVVQMAPQCHC